MGTSFASQSASSPAAFASASIAVVVADPFAQRRIGAALAAQGLKPTRFAATVNELLESCHGPHPDAIVLACNPFEAASLAAIRRVADTMRTSPVVVVSSASDGVGIRQAVNAGADGVVYEAELETTLAPATQAVLVGHVSLPRRFHRCVVKPVFSHREKQVLGMVVRGYGNRQIADRLFLAESTVKSHLSTAFQKLGVRSRKEAAALLMDPEEGLENVLQAGEPAP
ncbi:MAG TPA: response regulator transcription factor [Thermoleophilaceae bacterium]|jgi:DNA-binding NarL/FixJ family response regulator